MKIEDKISQVIGFADREGLTIPRMELIDGEEFLTLLHELGSRVVYHGKKDIMVSTVYGKVIIGLKEK